MTVLREIEWRPDIHSGPRRYRVGREPYSSHLLKVKFHSVPYAQVGNLPRRRRPRSLKELQ
jgi:hypothetical protein